jgi:hypothetical protein
MYELAHYVVAKYSIATTNAEFCICGDDIVFAADNKEDGNQIYSRYKEVMEFLGSKIEPSKSFLSPLCEGVGKLYFTTRQGEIIDLTPPNGNISPIEARCDTYLKTIISKRTPLGTAILYSWMSPTEEKSYTYEDRRRFWRWLLTSEYFLSKDSYNNLLKRIDNMPQTWSWDEDDPLLRRELRREDSPTNFKFVSSSILKEAILTTKIKSLLKET